MRLSIEDIKHCLKVMAEEEVCEECNLYGTTGTDHCEHDCVCGALDIIDKYQKIEQIVNNYISSGKPYISVIDEDIRKVIEDGKIGRC